MDNQAVDRAEGLVKSVDVENISSALVSMAEDLWVDGWSPAKIKDLLKKLADRIVDKTDISKVAPF